MLTRQGERFDGYLHADLRLDYNRQRFERVPAFLMCTPMQRKYATGMTHWWRVSRGKALPPLDHTKINSLLYTHEKWLL